MSIHNFAKSTCLTALCAAAIHLPLFADTVNPDDYEQTFNVKFAGYSGTTTLTNFPALIRLSAELNKFKYDLCAENGADLRFADSEGNPISHEIDTWNTNGVSLVWVKVPSLTKSTVIKVFYGYKGNAPQSPVNASDVWDAGYVAVWHMKANSGLNQLDSTVNSLTLSLPEDCADNVIPGVDGIVGKSADMGHRIDGLGNYGLYDGTGKLDGFANATFEIWTKQDANPTNQVYIISPFKQNTHPPYVVIQYDTGNTGMGYYVDADGTPTYIWGGSYGTQLGVWNHHAFRFNSGTGLIDYFQNGVSRYNKTEPAATNRNLTSVKESFTVGSYTTKFTENKNFVGQLDEIRISNVARSEDWVKATYATITDEGFASYEVQNDWEVYTHKFTVAFPGVTEGATLEDFPVLVKVAEYDQSTGEGIAGFRYADCAKAGGGDLRFTDGNGTTPLPCEVEVWNTNGTSLIWVKVPTLTKSTKIIGYYGWTFAPAVVATEVWDENYLAVWHMDAATGTRSQKDSTVNGKTVACPSSYANAVSNGVAGILGTAARCGLRDDNLGGFSVSDPDGYFAGLGAITMEAWTFKDSEAVVQAVDGAIVHRMRATGSWVNIYSMYEAKESHKIGFWLYKSDNSPVWPSAPAAPTLGEWHYHARRWNGTSGYYAIFEDKAKTSGGSTPASPQTMKTSDGEFCIGNRATNSNGTTPFRGDIDEVRISKVARSDAWINATYDTIANNATFTKYGIAKENRAWGMIVIVR